MYDAEMAKKPAKVRMVTRDFLMTRAEVRDALDRSITTVRRFELQGVLRPHVDRLGVHWFERHEVEALSRKLAKLAPREVTITARDGRRVAALCGLPWPFSPAQLVAACMGLRGRVRELAAALLAREAPAPERAA